MERNINIDLRKEAGNIAILHQGDSGIDFYFNIKDDNSIVDLTDTTVKLFVLEKDESNYYSDLEVTEAERGICKFGNVGGLTKTAGYKKLQAVIYIGETIYSSFVFSIKVNASIRSEVAEALEGGQTVFDQMTEEINNLRTKVQQLLDTGLDNESIAEAINDYLAENPVQAMSNEQILSIVNEGITNGAVDVISEVEDGAVTTDKLADDSVDMTKVDFITVSDNTELLSLSPVVKTSILPTGVYQTEQPNAFRTVTFTLEKNTEYMIERALTNRFRVALYTEEPINGTAGQLIIDNATLEKCTFNSMDYSYCSILYTSNSEALNIKVTKLDENKSYILDSRIEISNEDKSEYKKYVELIGLSNMTFTGTWAEVNNDLALLGVYKQSNTANSTVSATFIGTQINIHYFSGGKVSINIDGNISILDTSSTETEEQIHVIDNLENKEHTLTISVLEGYFKIDYFTVIKESTELEEVINKEEINKIDTDFKTKENIKTSSLKTKLLRATKSYLLRSGTTTLEDYKEILLNTTRKCILTYNLSSLKDKKINKAILKLTNSLNATKKNCTTDSNKFYVGYLKVSPEALTYDTLDETNNVEYLDESTVYWIEAWYSCSTIDITNTIKAMLQNNGYGIVLKWECLDSDGNAITNTLVYNDNDMSNSLYIEYSEDNEYPCESVNNKLQNGITELLNNNFNNKYDWSYTGPYECLLMLYEEYGITEALAVLETYFNHYISDDGTNNSCTDLYKAELSRILLKLYKITGKSKYLTTVTNTLSLYSTAENGIYLVNGGAITELSYFGMPFLLEYAEYFNESKYVGVAINQLLNLYCLISRNQADKVLLTVYNHDFSKGWSRGLGWFITGLAKCLTYNSIKNHKMYETLVTIFKDVCETLLKYQQDSGLWKAIIHLEDSFEETSGTSLLITAFEIGLREGLLDSRFTISKYKAIEGLSKKLMAGVNLEDVSQFNGKNNHIYCLEKNTSDIGWSLAMESLLNVYK